MFLEILNTLLNKSFPLNEDLNAIKKNFKNIPDDKFIEIIALDPTYKEGRNSAGKYGKWLLNIYNKGNLKEEDFSKVNGYLSDFENLKELFTNKDIQQFKSLDDLKQKLDQISVEDLSINQKDKRFKKEIKKYDLDADKVYEDSDWEVWIPHTYEASCKLSSSTRWCTGISSKGDDAYYKFYTQRGPLYIILNKKDPRDKYQFHFESSSFMDSENEAIDLSDFFMNSEGLKNYFIRKYPHFEIQLHSKFYQDELDLDNALTDAEGINEAQFVSNILNDLPEKIEFHGNLNTYIKWLRELGMDRVYSWQFIYDLFKDPYEAACSYNLSPYEHESILDNKFFSIKNRLLKEPKFNNFLKKNNMSIDDFEKEINEGNFETDSISDIVLSALDEAHILGWAKTYLDVIKRAIISAFKLEDGFLDSNDISCSLILTRNKDDLAEITVSYTKEDLLPYLTQAYIGSENSPLYKLADEYTLDENGNFDFTKFIYFVATQCFYLQEVDDLYFEDCDMYDEDTFVEQILANLDYIKL